MEPLLVVFHTPAFHDDPSFKQGSEELPVEAFIAELVMEAFDVAVLIRLSPRPVGPSSEALCRCCSIPIGSPA